MCFIIAVVAPLFYLKAPFIYIQYVGVSEESPQAFANETVVSISQDVYIIITITEVACTNLKLSNYTVDTGNHSDQLINSVLQSRAPVNVV